MDLLFQDIAVVVVVSAFLSVIALLTRQPILVAYILAGVLCGPHGAALISNTIFLDHTGTIGVTLLLFLAGLELQARHLLPLMKVILGTTLLSCALFAGIIYAYTSGMGFSSTEAIIAATAMMFSSTILVIKLLPTITLHQKHMGAVCIGILILQDMLAIFTLIILGTGHGETSGPPALIPLIAIMLIAGAFALEHFLLRHVLKAAHRFHETLYLVALAWCLGMAYLAKQLGLSIEVGAFIAGLSLARNPISAFLFEGLKFFRDFFLLMFFFVLGTQLDWSLLPTFWHHLLLLSAILLFLKPLIFESLLRLFGETQHQRQTGIRLGQAGEFALIISMLALSSETIRPYAAQFITFTTISTMTISSYLVVWKYRTPVGLTDALKQD